MYFTKSSLVFCLVVTAPLISCQKQEQNQRPPQRPNGGERSSSLRNSRSIPEPQPPSNTSPSSTNKTTKPAFCMPLKGTKTCTEFGDLSVYTDPDLFSNLEEFDTYIQKSQTNSSVYQDFFRKTYNCPNWNGKGLRYPISFLCGLIVDVSTARNGCNSNKPVKQICASTANYSIASFQKVFKDTNACPQQGNRTLPQDYLIFASNKRLTKDDPEKDCLLGLPSETATCGFSTLEEASEYCNKDGPRASMDPCCQNVRRGEAPSTTSTAPSTPASPSPSVTPKAADKKEEKKADDKNVKKEAHSESSEQRGNVSKQLQPMVIVAIVISGVVMIAIVVGIIYFARRDKPQEKGNLDHLDATIPRPVTFVPAAIPNNAVELPKSEIMEVIYEYTPNLFDEIQLCMGDKIDVKHMYDDGWAFGVNLNTSQEGSFPLACVAPQGAAPSSLPSNSEFQSSLSRSSRQYPPSMSRTSFGQYTQRASSLYVPHQP